MAQNIAPAGSRLTTLAQIDQLRQGKHLRSPTAALSNDLEVGWQPVEDSIVLRQRPVCLFR
ncbi:MAG: hypothetical protein DMG70_31860 [Acidobacteria bacterium]|nr:MAG: hypothetical protein DMG70_31860 [Acidobacteriota bacterium]